MRFAKCQHTAHLACVQRRWYTGGTNASITLCGSCQVDPKEAPPVVVDLGDLDQLFYDPLDLRAERERLASKKATHSTSDSASDDRGMVASITKTFSSLGQEISARLETNPLAMIEARRPLSFLIKQNINATTLLRADGKRGQLFDLLMNAQYRAYHLRQLQFRIDSLVNAGMTPGRWEKHRKVLPVDELHDDRAGLGVKATDILRCLCDSSPLTLHTLNLTPDEWVTLCAPHTPASFFLESKLPASHLKDFGKEFPLRVWRHTLGLDPYLITKFNFSKADLFAFVARCSSVESEDLDAKAGEFELLWQLKLPEPDRPQNVGQQQQQQYQRVGMGPGPPAPYRGLPATQPSFGPARGYPGRQ